MICPHGKPPLQGVCDNNRTMHCIHCCRSGCGTSGPDPSDLNWRPSVAMTENQKISIEHECESCSGTGLYCGLGEQAGAAIVCGTCKGTAKVLFERTFKLFSGRKEKKGVKRVFQCNPGIGIGEHEDVKLKDFGGISHKDWSEGKPFGPGTEMRRFTCPAWWYQQADHERMPKWKECPTWGGSFKSCNSFKDKAACWERFDKEKL